MTHRVVFWSVLFVLVLAVGAQAADDSVTAKGSCSGDADAQLQGQVSTKGAEVQLKLSGSKLTANTTVTCGYICANGGAAYLADCGPTDDKGKWKFQETLVSPGACQNVAPLAIVGGSTCAASIQ